jgi:predicted DNA-binding protein
MKNVGIRVRLEPKLREEFVAACHAENRPASEVLRELMEKYIQHYQAGQLDLFGNKKCLTFSNES